MVEPTPSPQPGCFLTILLTMLSGFLLYFGGNPAVETPPPALRYVLAPQTGEAADLQGAVEVLQRRLIALGVEGATVQVADGRIVVEVSGSVDSELLTQTGLVELVDFSGVSRMEIDGWVAQRTVIQTTGREGQDGMVHPATGAPFQTLLTGDRVADAYTQLDVAGYPSIQIDFTPEGSAIMGEFTASHIGEALGIVLDGVILSAPTIQAQVTESAVINGVFTEAEARQLAAQITSGALPVPLILESIEIVE
jgi:preprotein translocase subunit SecD